MINSVTIYFYHQNEPIKYYLVAVGELYRRGPSQGRTSDCCRLRCEISDLNQLTTPTTKLVPSEISLSTMRW